MCLRTLQEASVAETKWPPQRERKVGEKVKEVERSEHVWKAIEKSSYLST